jgi:hypothetical protein
MTKITPSTSDEIEETYTTITKKNDHGVCEEMTIARTKDVSDLLKPNEVSIKWIYVVESKKKNGDSWISTQSITHHRKSKVNAMIKQFTDENIQGDATVTKKFHPNFRTILCWMFKIYPLSVIKAIVNQSCYYSVSMKDNTGYWKNVATDVNMYRDIIEAGPNDQSQEYKYLQPIFENEWDGESYVDQFNTLLAKEISTLDLTTFGDTKFTDPLAAVIGESNVPSYQEKYIQGMTINTGTIHLALYCFRHANHHDISTLCQLNLAEACIGVEKRLQFLVRDIFEHKYKVKFSSIENLYDFLKEHYMSSSPSGSESSSCDDVECTESTESESASCSGSTDDVTEESLPYDTTYVNELSCLLNMREYQNTLPAVTQEGLLSNASDDLVFGLENFLSKHSGISKTIILENIVVRAIDIICSDNVLSGFEQVMKYIVHKRKMFTKNDVKIVLETLNEQTTVKILETSSESPKWVVRVLEMFSKI